MSNLPTVSIVIVNLNGRSLLGDCLDAIAAQDYTEDSLETILVDNGSTDTSVAFVREEYPWVRIHEAGRNLGFAGGNNLGAEIATGHYLALINNDAVADPRWVRSMVEVLESDPEAVCASSKMLDPDGERIDFVGTAMNLYGRAFQIDWKLPIGTEVVGRSNELLAPCGGAMMIDRNLYRQVGGFDDDFIIYYEDVDLGWRLWLMGYKVLLAPHSVVYHKPHQTGGRFPVEQLYTLTELNALRLLIKNTEDRHLWPILAFSLFMGVTRSLEQAQLDKERYRYGRRGTGDVRQGLYAPEEKMTRVATSYLVAIDQVAEEMPHLLKKRQRIQGARVRSDEEIFERFPLRTDNPIFPWRRSQVVQDQLIEGIDISPVLRPQHGSRLLIITHETIGPRMAGPGIRAWEMACALSARFEVMLAAPGKPERSHPRLHVVGYDTGDPAYSSLDPYIANASVVLAMGPLIAKVPRLRDLGKPTIVDLYDPFELEKLAHVPSLDRQYHLIMDLDSMHELHLEGSAGDFFVCASERQRDFWLGMLLASGRINAETHTQDPTLRMLIDVVPSGMPAEPPSKQQPVLKGAYPGIGTEDKVLLWNGGLWQWFDPDILLDALVLVLAKRDDVKLFFAAGTHFDLGTVPEMPIQQQTLARCHELGLLDRHVFFGDWIPYDRRADYLLEADLAVSISKPSLESRFASRLRLLDCIWAGLPVVMTPGDPVADLMVEYGLGRTVRPDDANALAEAILEMLADQDLRHRVQQQAQPLRDQFAWARCIEPIAGFMERVSFAPDALEATRRAAELRRMATYVETMTRAWEIERHQMRERVEGLEAHIEAIKEGRVMRLLRAIDLALGRIEPK